MKILFFSLHAWITGQSIPEAIVVEALKKRGHDIITVNCDGALSRFCVSMSAAGLAPQASAAEKESVCEICRNRRNVILNEFGFDSIMLDEYINNDEELSIQNIFLNISPENYLELNIMGVPVGRCALYEFLINKKLNSTSLSNANWEDYKIFLHGALKTFYGGRRILEDVKPDAIAMYNTLYSVNHTFCALAEQRGIPFYSLEAGNNIKKRLSYMTIFKGHYKNLFVSHSKSWKEFSKIPVSPRQVQAVVEHIEELFMATSPLVYSLASNKVTPETLREFFGIDKNKSVLLATMSSADELFAATAIDVIPPFPDPMFPTHIDWINALIEFVRKRNDLFLIIRVHPREFPNKRESVLSQQAIELQKLFVNLPGNVRINWPQDKISIHDLIKITDVGLNATSTVGLELGMFGVPVVIYNADLLLVYPPENNYVGSDPEDYFKKIDMALKDGWSYGNVRKTFRWWAYLFDRVSIDISDGYRETTEPSLPDRWKRGNDGLWSLFWGKILKNAQIVIRSLDSIYKHLLIRLHMNSYYEMKLLRRQIRNRAIPVKNSELLSIAIEKNLESHLDIAPITQDVQNMTEEEEKIAICNQLRKLAQAVLLDENHPDEFTNRINRVLSV